MRLTATRSPARSRSSRLVRPASSRWTLAMAVALEQEMRARVQDAKAYVISEEAKIPVALSGALRLGRLQGIRVAKK